MSTITVSNIKKTGETASRDVSGVAAAWVNFNGTGTVAVRDSMNVASLTDNGTGAYTLNLSDSMDNSNYSVSAASEAGGGSGNKGPYLGTLAAGNSTLYVFNGTGSFVDSPLVTTSLHGDLA